MKKIIALFCSILLFSASCFGYSYPRWRTMPLNVYIPEQGQYSKLMVQAFDAWQQKSGGLVRFKYVKRQSAADIYVDLVDYVKGCGSDNAVGCTHYGYVKGGYFTQNYITIGMKDMKIIRTRDGKIIKQEIERPLTNIYGCMIHEIGHAIGLEHNNNPDSIMYFLDRPEFQIITDYDLQLIKEKYN